MAHTFCDVVDAATVVGMIAEARAERRPADVVA